MQRFIDPEATKPRFYPNWNENTRQTCHWKCYDAKSSRDDSSVKISSGFRPNEIFQMIFTYALAYFEFFFVPRRMSCPLADFMTESCKKDERDANPLNGKVERHWRAKGRRTRGCYGAADYWCRKVTLGMQSERNRKGEILCKRRR